MATADSIDTLPEGARAVPGFPDYCVTADGVVYSRKVYGSRTGRTGAWWAMKPKTRKRVGWQGGYLYVDLFRRRGTPERWLIHHLVLEAFVATRPEGMFGRHLDDDRLNNVLGNLAWGTRQDNLDDACRNGKISQGQRHYNAKRTDEDVREIRRLAAEGVKHRVIAAKYGVSPHYIAKIACREIWKHVN